MSDNTFPSAGRPWFEYLPVGLFGSVMGLTGLSLVWRGVHMQYGVPVVIGELIAMLAILDFLVLAAAYMCKLVTAPEAVRAEFEHPVTVNMFATFWISLLLLPIVIAPLNLLIARLMWALGALGMLGLAWFIVSRWLKTRHERPNATPAWFLPVVGLLDLPLALPYLGLPELHPLSVAGLSIGLFFALPLFTLVFVRLVFEAAMPPALQPSLLILVAPSAVGLSTYTATTGRFDLFAQSLYWVTLFLLAVVLGLLRHLPACCPFRMAWWAVSFPLAASAVAALRFAQSESAWWAHFIAALLVTLATLIILWLCVRSVAGIARGQLRTLSS